MLWNCAQELFYQIVLCLNVPNTNSLGSDSQSWNQQQLLSPVVLNCLGVLQQLASLLPVKASEILAKRSFPDEG